MIVYMDVVDPAWITPYFAAVPALLAEYGGVSVAGSTQIQRIEGDLATPQRIAVLSFPSLADVERFMADDRYAPYREMREEGAVSSIFVFNNAVSNGGLV